MLRSIDEIRADMRKARAALDALPKSAIESGFGSDFEADLESLQDELQQAEKNSHSE